MNVEEAKKKLLEPKKIPLVEIIRKFKREGIENFVITRPEIVETLLTAYEKEKEKNKDMSCDLTETRADNIDESTMLKQIKLKLQEKNIPIETLLAEFERLEDLEDDLTIVYLNGVYDGEKKVKDKIKAKIEEVKDGTFDAKIVLQSLLEKE